MYPYLNKFVFQVLDKMRIICDTFQNKPFICIPENIFFVLWIKKNCIHVLKGFQDVISRFYPMLVTW